jgi:hypothetical protein
MSAIPTQITSFQIVERNSVIGELAVFVPPAAGSVNDETNWTITHPPVASAFYQNGLRQASGSDYTIVGNTITSPTWQSTDRILCDYQY